MPKQYTHPDPWLRGKLQTLCQEMRQAPTPAEALLWQRLRGRQVYGYKFRRQHPVDRFIVDFYCASAGLIIEVDGEVHRQQIEADREREQILTDLGFRVIRFTNSQVLEQTDRVLQQILEALISTPSPESHVFRDSGEGAGG